MFYFFTMAQQPQWAKASSLSRIHDHTPFDTPHSVELLSTSGQTRRDLYLTTHNTQDTHIHAPGGIRTHNPRKRAAADLRLRPCGHWDRQNVL